MLLLLGQVKSTEILNSTLFFFEISIVAASLKSSQ